MAEKPFCQGKLNFLGDCERKPTVVRDGKHYCWQHDPERRKTVAKERWEKRKAEIAKIEADSDARIARRKLERASGVNDLSDDDLKAIIARGGIQTILGHPKGDQS